MEIDCPLSDDCVLFRSTLAEQPNIARLMKARYCDLDREGCALRTVANAIGPENVPEGMFPNQTGRAEKLIKDHFIKQTAFGRGAIEGLT